MACHSMRVCVVASKHLAIRQNKIENVKHKVFFIPIVKMAYAISPIQSRYLNGVVDSPEPVTTPLPMTVYENVIASLQAGPNPSIFVFDCDWTLYPYDCDKERIGPFSWSPWNGVSDCYGRPSNSYIDVPSIFGAIIDTGIPVAFLSRNPSAAQVKQLLSVIPCITKVNQTKKCLLDAMPDDTYFHVYSSGGIGKGKDKHFSALKTASGIPFSEMLFFDDILENIQAAQVQRTTAVLLGKKGLIVEAFTDGLDSWRKSNI